MWFYESIIAGEQGVAKAGKGGLRTSESNSRQPMMYKKIWGGTDVDQSNYRKGHAVTGHPLVSAATVGTRIYLHLLENR